MTFFMAIMFRKSRFRDDFPDGYRVNIVRLAACNPHLPKSIAGFVGVHIGGSTTIPVSGSLPMVFIKGGILAAFRAVGRRGHGFIVRAIHCFSDIQGHANMKSCRCPPIIVSGDSYIPDFFL